ncbi:MAG TPA: rRNA pseudouridine synthase [Thermotoga sp.]|uniref:pseudouridine synthase n=1 Tax=Thermotoga sp. (strain RQ2) TaxID=126740 RepID=UPI0001601C31|nr:pseudouridine synthase [Thermotoga sp. RQ2]ACB09037.1 pseudouridine synthase [Thermotoga sp. RQ2]HBF69860.1 rRNA pseudouridine synthase [Thermotoga sp.]
MRLDRYLSNSGVGTRKEVKKLIKQGRVTVNGRVVLDPGHPVLENDAVALDGEVVRFHKKVYILFYKPSGYVTSTKDPHSETIMEFLPPLKGIFPVGRLDKDAEGLLIITNDGDFAHRVISPKWSVEKEYIVKVEGEVTEDKIEKLKNGVTLRDGFFAKAKCVEKLSNDTLKIVITEGKYHQIKRMTAAVGLKTVHLKRTRIGGLVLPDDMKPGEYRFLSEEEVKKVFEREDQKEDTPRF